jgi:hypothetical protein
MLNLPTDGKKISNWDKPGGTLGMIVLGLMGAGGLYLLYKFLPFLSAIVWNTVNIAVGVGILALMFWLVTDKQIRTVVSAAYFMLMRAITGAIIDIDPISIVMQKVLKMKKKIQEISVTMGTLNGLIREGETKLEDQKRQLKSTLLRVEELNRIGDRESAIVSNNKAVRLEDAINRRMERLNDSKKWYEILSKLEKMAKLTVEDTENAVEMRREEYEEIKKQHKAFKSVMSIVNGDPDEMALFDQAMEKMSNEINDKVGEMEHVLNTAGGLISQFNADSSVNSRQAQELLDKYNNFGIEGMFKSFDKKQIDNQPVNYINTNSIVDVSYTEVPKTTEKKKYF